MLTTIDQSLQPLAQTERRVILAIADRLRAEGVWDWNLQRHLDLDVSEIDRSIEAEARFLDSDEWPADQLDPEGRTTLLHEWEARASDEAGIRVEWDGEAGDVLIGTTWDYIDAGRAGDDETAQALAVCGACLMMAANREAEISDGDPAPLGLIEPGAEIVPDGSDHWFSAADCPACGQRLAGDRHPVLYTPAAARSLS